MAKWKEFEQLAAAIGEQLAPDAVIHHDKHLADQTGEQRQFDVIIEVPSIFKSLLVAIECKFYNRPVGVDKVEAFVTKVRDCHVNQGIMVSPSSFTRGARKKAAAHNLILLSYRQAQEADWHLLADPAAWMSIITREIDEIVVRAVFTGRRAIRLTVSDLLYLEDRTPYVRAFDAASIFMNQRLSTFPHQLGTQWQEGQLRTPEGNVLYIARDNFLIPIDRLSVQFKLRAFSYPINTAFATGHVLEDAHSGAQSYKEVQTLPFNPEAVIRSQKGRELTPEEFAVTSGIRAPLPLELFGDNIEMRLTITFPNERDDRQQ